MKKTILYMVTVLAALILLTGTSLAHRAQDVDIEIVSERGTAFITIPFKDYGERGTQVVKRYLEAREGENYRIVVRNNTPYRIAAVIAVDGRNIISGEQSYLKDSESMYIVDPYQHQEYAGWRTDQDTVHRFLFTDVGESYSVRTFGDVSAMGVIAVSLFREKQHPPILRNKERREGAAAPAAPGKMESEASRDGRAGTGFGDGMHSPTAEVEFAPEHRPFKKVLVKYEWHEVLCRKGILACRDRDRNRLWDDGGGFAPFPPDYRG
jgi:hypothetical protein